MDRIWLKHYSPGVPADIDPGRYANLIELIETAFKTHGAKPAYKMMGASKSFAEIDEASKAMAAYLQGLGLVKGDRVAIMMPNVFQYPVAIAAVLRAGFVAVNVNPLYTPRELEHQLKDSGAKAIIIVENFLATLKEVFDKVPTKHVILASIGDMFGFLKGMVINYVVRKKNNIQAIKLPGMVRFNDALAKGRSMSYTAPKVAADDIALLQYTGGTTGVSKGAVLLHRNLVANVLQAEAFYEPALKKVPAGEQVHTVCALPLYHIFGFTANLMLSMHKGGVNILIPNPRDIPAVFKELSQHRIHSSRP